MECSGFDLPSSNFRSQLNGRLLDTRTIVVNEELTPQVAGQVTEQLAVLDAESAEPIQVMMSNVPGGDMEAGLSTYDLLRSLTAPATALASGRIAGAGILAFVGVPGTRRFALPHARFRFREPADVLDRGPSVDLEEQSEAAIDRRERVVAILAEGTEQSRKQIEADLSDQRAFDPNEAAAYGLLHRVVENRREIE